MSLFFYLFHEVLFFHQNNHKSELKGKKRLHTINHLRSISYKYKNTICRLLYKHLCPTDPHLLVLLRSRLRHLGRLPLKIVFVIVYWID